MTAVAVAVARKKQMFLRAKCGMGGMTDRSTEMFLGRWTRCTHICAPPSLSFPPDLFIVFMCVQRSRIENCDDQRLDDGARTWDTAAK